MPERIRLAIARAGGDAAVSARSGVKRRSLQHYKSGSARPNAETIGLIAKATGVSLDWLIYGEDSAGTGFGEKSAAFESQPAPIDEDLLAISIMALEDVLSELGRSVTPETKARLIVRIYAKELEARAAGRSGISGAEIIRLVRGAG